MQRRARVITCIICRSLTVMDGVSEYHTTALKNIEIDKRQIAPPPKVRLNKDNISIPQNALLNTFRKDTQNKGNPYNVLFNQHCGKFYSIMHDGVQKFAKELNGVFIRTLSETSNIVNVPWALKEIEGGLLNAQKFIDHIIATIISIHPLPSHSSAFHEILSLVAPGTEGFCPEKPPEHFKAYKLLFHDEQNKI